MEDEEAMRSVSRPHCQTDLGKRSDSKASTQLDVKMNHSLHLQNIEQHYLRHEPPLHQRCPLPHYV
uniref:Uncharacterized protein n=1 Tax=Megaselia scalaris TaxID=36166 RepID=T1GUS8_MEGSC